MYIYNKKYIICMQIAYIRDLEGQTTVRVDAPTQQQVGKFIEANKEILRKEYGITSIGSFYDRAVIEYIQSLTGLIQKLPPFKHVNAYEDHIVLQDIRSAKMYEIYFKNDKLMCIECKSSECTHIIHALELNEVKNELRRRGFKPPKVK